MLLPDKYPKTKRSELFFNSLPARLAKNLTSVKKYVAETVVLISNFYSSEWIYGVYT